MLESRAGRAVRGAPVKYQARRRADLSGRMLRGEDLREVDWRDAKLVGADLSGALLYGADLGRRSASAGERGTGTVALISINR